MREMKGSKISQLVLTAVLAAALLAVAGCAVQPSVSENSNASPPVDEFKAELTALRNADFDYIYSFRRKDGTAMSSEDKQFVKNNSHFATNRFTLTTDEKVIFAGSNYKFRDDGLAALKERFEFEDYSKPAAELEKKRKEREALEEESNKSAEPNSMGG